MKRGNLLRKSTRFRLAVTLGAMLLPVIVLAFASFILFNGFIDSFIEVTDEMVGQIQPKLQIQGMLSGFMRDMDHFVLDPGESKERIALRQADRVDRAFINLFKISFSHKGEQKKIDSAFQKWKKAKTVAIKLLNDKEIKEEVPRQSPRRLERVDFLVTRSNEILENANRFDLGEIREEIEDARAGRRNNMLFMSLVIITGIAIALGAGAMLARSILHPLAALEEGVRRLGSGDLNYRVHMEIDDELGRVGAAFNIMAGRLELDQAALADLAMHDELTGLLNRRELFRFLGQRLSG